MPSHFLLSCTLSLPHLPAAVICFEPWPGVCLTVDLVAAFIQVSPITAHLLSGTHVSCSPHSPKGAWWSLPGQTEINTSQLVWCVNNPPWLACWGRGVPTYLSAWHLHGTVTLAYGAPRGLEQLCQHCTGRRGAVLVCQAGTPWDL